MPLSRYQLRNEYSLADPELYKSADKDDPEALLEGVAMAGLVGVLRQLGDLAEFAAEVFHNLHEEVMATAARGHSLTVRVQQLEVEFPLIEKAFLSQTNHSAFFYNAGIDWHPNMHIDQNYITRGDLPRFVRDSHEEARGPPRLFLLDKFDVAGAGACLKRFTDPSFYKVEVTTNADIQRDKKVRKIKRRGSRWKNGETPEVLTTPHAKLHQLLLEERTENSASDPTRRIKLKRRLNGFPFVLKTGKSYMEKILLTPPPDYRELHEVYNYNSSPLKILGSNFVAELEKDDFGSESPDVEFTRRSPSMSPDLKDGIQNVSMSEMEFESSNGSSHFKPEFGRVEIGTESPDLQLTHRSPYLTPEMQDSVPNIFADEEFESLGIESKDFPKVTNSLKVDNIPSPLYEDPVDKQIIVDKESKSDGSAGYKSVDFASDAENYMDALATMELEMETDSELREKGNLHVLSNRKRISGPGASTPLRETHFSDSQSIGSSTLSDDGNSSSKKCKSNSSYSGSPHIKTYLEDELSDLIDSSNEAETKSISRPLKWRGRTRNAGGNKISVIPPYNSAPVVKTFPNTDVSPGSMVHRDADASVGDNGVSQLKLEGMLSAEGVPGDEPSNVNERESNMSVNLPSGSSLSATHLQREYDSINRVVYENHYSNNGEESHMIESSSCKPIMSDDTCFTEGFKNQHMEEIVDKNILYMVQDDTPAPCSLDGAPLNCEENHSSPKNKPLSESSNEGPQMSEHPLKPSPASCAVEGAPLNLEENLSSPENQPLSEHQLNPSLQEISENGLQEDLSNHEIGASEVLGVFHKGSVNSSSCREDIGEEEMSKQSLENMPQAGDEEDDFQVYPVVSQSDSRMTIMPPAAEQSAELRFLVLETDDRETDAKSTDDNQIGTVSPPNSDNLRISGMAYILQPLGPVDSTTNDQIEEKFPDLSLSDTEDSSDGTDHNIILSGGSNVALLGGEIAVEEKTLSGILEGAYSEDIQTPVVLDSVLQSDVEISDNGDENLHEFPSLAVRVETDLVKESPSVRPEISALNEMQISETADDMLLLNSTRVETSSEQMENLHALQCLVGQKLEGVSSSTDSGERSTADGESIDGSLNTRDADVDFGKTQPNQYPVDIKVPLSIMCKESGTEEKGNMLKVASPLMDYDHTESRILVKLSNSYPESDSSLHTDITASSTPEQSGSHMNVIRAEKNKLEDDTMDSLPIPMYCYTEEQSVNLPLHQREEKETEIFRIQGESNLDLHVADSSVLEQSESSSKCVDSDKGVLTSYTQDTSPVSTHRDEEGQKIRLHHHQLDEEINQVSTIEGESNVLLEPQLTERQNVDRLLGQDGISGIASISFSRFLPGQQSASELFPWEKPKIDDAGQHNEPFGLLSQAVDTDEVEMPPLPPLPPVQWRMGKTQQASLAYEKTVLPNNNILFPSISLGSNSNLLALGELQPLNDFAAVSEFDSPNQNLLLPANNSQSSSTCETLQNLPLPSKLDEMPQHDDHTCTNSSGTNGDAATAAACDVELVVGSSSPIQFNKAEATSQTKLSHQGSASSENNAGTHDASGLLTKIEDEWPHNMMLSLEGVAWPTQEEGKPYGVRPMKLPRQRNPLIDAVIALDKSKLRKVTEQPRTHVQKADELDSVLENLQLRKVSEQPRTQIQKVNERDSVLENMQLRKVTEHPRPQIQEADERDSALENLQLRKVPKQHRPQMQEADERDSLLEQIRAKSFNLKPPVVSKPAVQGPTTNLKLAAILEKAKTIRQAFAGSDEDDDDDSWSDS